MRTNAKNFVKKRANDSPIRANLWAKFQFLPVSWTAISPPINVPNFTSIGAKCRPYHMASRFHI